MSPAATENAVGPAVESEWAGKTPVENQSALRGSGQASEELSDDPPTLSIATRRGDTNEGRERMGTSDPVECMEPEEIDLVGRVVAGRYLIQRRLGEGGMGVVYAALDERIEKQIAIKVLRADYTKRTDVVARFTQEAKSAARIKHENVLDVTDYGQTEDGGFYIAMELLRGTDLADVLGDCKTLSGPRGIEIAVQVCRALAAAHSKGIVHRDLKPENVFIVRSDDGREVVKIVDFGIAQMKDLSGAESNRKLTRTGMIFGTPEYMSPEQAAGRPIDHRVDIYAVGVILYEMFAGRVPFVGESFMGILTQHMFEHPLPFAEISPGVQISPELEAVVFKAMAKDPNERYGSMVELADDLNRVRTGARPLAPAPDFSAVLPKLGARGTGFTPAPRVAGAPGAGPTDCDVMLPASVGLGVSKPTPQMTGVSRTIESELPRPNRRPMSKVVVLVCVVVVAALAAVAIGSGMGLGTTAAPRGVSRPTVITPVATRVEVRGAPSVVSVVGAGPEHPVVLVVGEDAGASGLVDVGVAVPVVPEVPGGTSTRPTVRHGHPRVRGPAAPQRPGCGGTDPTTGLLIPCFQQ